MKNQTFVTSFRKIKQECGEDICGHNSETKSQLHDRPLAAFPTPRKLHLLREWLYQDHCSGEMYCRIAPSVIVRSEAELFGVSSPRCAIRAYLTPDSFVNIRRRRFLAQMIRKTLPQTKLTEAFARETEGEDNPWIADSLLEPPRRLIERGFEFLHCEMGTVFGEVSEIEQVPFVTHVKIGGGLCAQAACFMALCLTPSNKIFGISEITKLAASEPNTFEIHGLTTKSLKRFFQSQSIGLGAQLQTYENPRDPKLTSVMIETAIRAYCRNRFPVIPIVSLFRLQGYHRPHVPEEAVIQLNEFDFDPKNFRKLPIGLKRTNDEQEIRRRLKGEKEANHCVIVVGCNEQEVCINDPATFPFLTATYDELVDCRAFKANLNVEAAIAKHVKTEFDIEEVFDNEDLAPFVMIAVTDRGIKLPLLDNSVPSATSGIAPPGSKGILSFAYDLQTNPSRLSDLGINLNFDDYQVGEFYLASKNTNGIDWQQAPPEVDLQGLANGLPDNKWYWVQVHGTDKERLSKRSYWFWNASIEETRVKESLSLVVSEDQIGKLSVVFSR